MSERSGDGFEPDGTGMRTVAVEIVAALVLMVGGIALIADAIRLGRGWASDGPEAGFYPFYVGLLLTGSAAFIAWRNVRRLRHDYRRFVAPGQFRHVLAMLLPSVVYVGAIYLIGIYFASALFLLGFMVFNGGYRPVRALPVALGVPAVAFALFELWFHVPLPKGPIETLLGF